MNTLNPPKLIALAKNVLELEARAVATLADRIDASFVETVRMILDCKGHVVVSGIGKSGHIARKVAATMASTGTPAFFVHPGEAVHGDLGMITANDVVIVLSNSGESMEILMILPGLKRLGTPLIAITGNRHSTLATEADICLDASVDREACPLDLAPTSSTTAALALGDALALALLEARGFGAEDFARCHPGGALGRRLLVRVRDVMRTSDRMPKVSINARLSDALLEMTRTGMGMTAIVDEDDRVVGIYTDGDLRRTFGQPVDIHRTLIRDVMNPHPHTISPNKLAAEAVQYMQKFKINGWLVVDDENRMCGALNMQDLLRAGVI